MDPKAALDIINDTQNESRAYRADCLEALSEWIDRGGFFPVGEPGEEMHPTLTEEACESLRSEGLYELACDLRVRLAYGE